MIDVSPLIGDLPTTTLTRRRFAASSINRFGETVDGAATDASRTVVAHTADGRTLERAGLDTERETLIVYDTEAIRGPDQGRPDQWLYQGRWYEVIRPVNRTEDGGICWAYAQLIEVNA